MKYSLILICLATANAMAAKVVVESEKDLERPLVKLTGAKANAVRSSSGNVYAVQDGEFQLPRLVKGAKETFEIVDAKPKPDEVLIQRTGKKLKITAKGKLLMEYQAEPGEFPRENIKPLFRRGGYLHPIYSLSGKTITDDFPPNHIHHHGIWFSWSLAEFEGRKTDFWNMGDGKGRVDFVKVSKTWSGPVHGGFTAEHRQVDMTGPQAKAALDETWEVRAYNCSPADRYWIFDLVCRQECATSQLVKFPENRYGGLGLRGNWAWNGKDAVKFLTSDGLTDRVKAHTMKARWCDMHGVIDGEPVGIAIMGHSKNFRAPEPMRVHPTEPFFNFAPQQAGDFEITPGKPMEWRYRMVIHDGPPDRELLDRLWNAYVDPPLARALN